MITIIHHGKKQYKYEQTCPKCGCVFGFNDNDVDVIGPFYDPVYSIYCPDCGYHMTTYDKDWE